MYKPKVKQWCQANTMTSRRSSIMYLVYQIKMDSITAKQLLCLLQKKYKNIENVAIIYRTYIDKAV